MFVKSEDLMNPQQLSSGNFAFTFRADLRVHSRGDRLILPSSDGGSKTVVLHQPVLVPVVAKVPKFGATQDDW
jgi:hypothetical protein